jgi:hypothetical protein
MTPPTKQYIITEEQLEELQSTWGSDSRKREIVATVLSHPFTSAPTQDTTGQEIKELFRKEIVKWKDEDPLFMAYVYGEEAGRKDEREKVLDELKSLMLSHIPEDFLKGTYRLNDEWMEAIESLRPKDGD